MKRIILIAALAISTTALADNYVQGYYRSDGTYVQGYYRNERSGGLDPRIFDRLDTNAPARMAELFNPIRREEQNIRLEMLRQQQELGRIQLEQARRQAAEYPQQ